MLANKLMGGSEDTLYVDDVFSTYLYTGNGSTQTINNGIDLAGKGGLVWLKKRGAGTGGNYLVDTVRGAGNVLFTNSTTQQLSYPAVPTSFNSNGFSLGVESGVNGNTDTQVSWTFRKAPKFFDVVTYTGNSTSGRSISHSLGQTPGMIIVKSTTGGTAGYPWVVWHRSLSAGNIMYLNTTEAQSANSNFVTAVSDTDFTLASSQMANLTGDSYVAYLFAHDTASDGLIQCGSFTSSASALSVTLGWEPQFLLVKRTSSADNWMMVDASRGLQVNRSAATLHLLANTSGAESGLGLLGPTATGFTHTNGTAGDTYIYLAIRRPNKPPTTGTQVYFGWTGNTTNPTTINSGFSPDLVISRGRMAASTNQFVLDRLRGSNASTGQQTLVLNSTDAEVASSGRSDLTTLSDAFRYQSDITSLIAWAFRRASGFFDVVCATAASGAVTASHNLTVAPELLILKARSEADNWYVYHAASDKRLLLNSTAAAISDSLFTVSASSFSLAAGLIGTSPTLVAYLFATLPGISKVGSYIGNGSSQTINCGFTTGARFILIKRTDSTGDWYVWDTARGIVAANDPHLSLNTTAAEVTTDDSVDPESTGFIVNQNTATNINVNGGSYIFLAIA